MRVQQVVVWFDSFYPDTQGCCGSCYTVCIQKHSVLWRSPLLLSVDLALVFVSGLYSTSHRATFPAFLCGCLKFVSTVCVILFVFSIFCLSRRCPLLATFLSVLFCLLSLLISERISGLIWFGSVYLMTTAGFVADQLM